MTKPCSFVLEWGGALMLVIGIIPPMNVGLFTFGVIAFLTGAIGIRKRLKKDKS